MLMMKLHKLHKHILRCTINEVFNNKHRGRPRRYNIDSIFYLVRSGCQWHSLPTCICNGAHYTTVFKFMQQCIKHNIFERVYFKFLRIYLKGNPSKYYAIDSTMVKNIYGKDCLGRNPVDRGRKGTKMSVGGRP